MCLDLSRVIQTICLSQKYYCVSHALHRWGNKALRNYPLFLNYRTIKLLGRIQQRFLIFWLVYSETHRFLSETSDILRNNIFLKTWQNITSSEICMVAWSYCEMGRCCSKGRSNWDGGKEKSKKGKEIIYNI